jgi:hypothetical protein
MNSIYKPLCTGNPSSQLDTILYVHLWSGGLRDINQAPSTRMWSQDIQ